MVAHNVLKLRQRIYMDFSSWYYGIYSSITFLLDIFERVTCKHCRLINQHAVDVLNCGTLWQSPGELFIDNAVYWHTVREIVNHIAPVVKLCITVNVLSRNK